MNHSYAEAARALGCTESWLRDNTPTKPLPHIKFGGGKGTVVFTDEHLEQIRKMFEVAPRRIHEGLRPIPARRAS